jgi:uncharacterized protein (DUF433 family)
MQDGQPTIRGTNIKAKMIGRMYLWEDRSIEDIMAHYGLSAGEVHAAIAFTTTTGMRWTRSISRISTC